MFGKIKETHDSDTVTDLTPPEPGHGAEDYFGDEAAAAEARSVDELYERVKQVEGQVNSQFTSLAAYAQIAQEQVELARAESRNETERTERRLIELIERERADRIAAGSEAGAAAANPWGAPVVQARLDALEDAVAQIRQGLNECLARQKALADAITALFEPKTPTIGTGAGPIDELSLG